ncbi:MAG TPA: hypothetical protein VFL36_21970 [Myxococcales bacterium]|nr:hypothetical protein [Myxococcales bacterium]
MRRALLCAALAAAACSSNPINTATGEFTSPTGIGATSAGDRDLLFIANSGQDSLRALQICNHPLLTDGGVDPADPCPANQHLQFVPAPIRVFPANVETGNRPLHVAGARLTRTDGIPAGVALSVGVDSTVAIVDAYALVQRAADGGVPLQADGGPAPSVTQLDVQAQAVDVAAANPLDSRLIETAAAAGSTVTAYVVTLAPELIWLDVGLDAANLPDVKVHARCTLEAGTVPARIAVPAGTDTDVYIADIGAAGGVVHVSKAGIAGGACVSNRIAAGGRRVRSVAASPTWFQPPLSGNDADPDIVHPPGEILMMVLEPLACSGTGPDCSATTAGIDLDPGGVLFARTTDGSILPVPPFDVLATGAPETMQPLGVPGPGIPLDAAFLRAVPPNPTTLLVSPDLAPCTRAPCTPLTVAITSGTPTRNFQLLAAMGASDGTTYLIDVANRRYVSSNFFALNTNPSGLDPTIDVLPVLSPAQITDVPTLGIDPSSLQAGVTRRGRWRVIWHSPVPGLDRRAGTVTPNPDGTMLFKTPPGGLSRWTQDPAIKLGPGDLVSFAAYVQSDPSPACKDLISRESLGPLRFELTILSVADDSLLLAAADPSVGFTPAGCPAFGAVAEIRTGGAQPWLVFEGSTVRGRPLPDGTFTAHSRRFDYPLNYTASPLAASDVAFRFTVTGAPATPVGGFTFSVSDNNTIVQYHDNLITSGLASAVYAYSSPRVQTFIFSSITGANELMQANPLLISTSIQGVLVYR